MSHFYWHRGLKEIETEKAKRRQVEAGQVHGKGQKLGKNFSGPNNKGRAADIASKKMGYSRPTMEKSVKVVELVDRLKGAGETEKADSLLSLLNNKSVDRAYKAVSEKKVKANGSGPAIKANSSSPVTTQPEPTASEKLLTMEEFKRLDPGERELTKKNVEDRRKAVNDKIRELSADLEKYDQWLKEVSAMDDQDSTGGNADNPISQGNVFPVQRDTDALSSVSA